VDPSRLTPRSPLLFGSSVCTLLLTLFVGLTIVTLMLVYYRSTSNPTLAAKLNRKTGLNPFKTMNEVLVMPAKVMGKTKDVVDKNNSRTGVVNGVIANPQGTSASADQVGGRTAAATDPTKSTASPPPVNTAVSADEKERLAPSLIDYSLAHAAEQQAEGTNSANLSQNSVPVGPATPMVATVDQPKRIQLGGAIVITIPVTTDTIEASETFTTWVTNAKISGSFPGNPGRVILNDRLTRAGGPAHLRLGITFVGLNAETRLLLFSDKAGASVARSY
jgi:hypothetical protein